MIINGNTFAYGAFQLDTRPLYIECEWDATQQKYVPVQDYTLQQITEAAKTRPVFLKAQFIAPLTYLSGGEARFELYFPYDPMTPTDSYAFVRAIRTKNEWQINVQDA